YFSIFRKELNMSVYEEIKTMIPFVLGTFEPDPEELAAMEPKVSRELATLLAFFRTVFEVELPFAGGTGESADDPVIVLDDTQNAVSFEYTYIKYLIGARRLNGKVVSQSLLNPGEKYLDQLTVELEDGRQEVYTFDITMYYTRMSEQFQRN
ncbi:MAG: hypothetical protein Q4F84_09730, partial [Fibrobacter sp.]|nr:hypothetical protein [Fibrobacter sp.]